jgi:hypothetical protein
MPTAQCPSGRSFSRVVRSFSRCASLSFLESVRPGTSWPSGQSTAAATTGPARQPLPASSTPASMVEGISKRSQRMVPNRNPGPEPGRFHGNSPTSLGSGPFGSMHGSRRLHPWGRAAGQRQPQFRACMKWSWRARGNRKPWPRLRECRNLQKDLESKRLRLHHKVPVVLPREHARA